MNDMEHDLDALDSLDDRLYHQFYRVWRGKLEKLSIRDLRTLAIGKFKMLAYDVNSVDKSALIEEIADRLASEDMS